MYLKRIFLKTLWIRFISFQKRFCKIWVAKLGEVFMVIVSEVKSCVFQGDLKSCQNSVACHNQEQNQKVQRWGAQKVSCYWNNDNDDDNENCERDS